MEADKNVEQYGPMAKSFEDSAIIYSIYKNKQVLKQTSKKYMA